MFTLTEKEIDRILDSVEKDLIEVQKSEALSKSEDSKEDGKEKVKAKGDLEKAEKGKEIKPVGEQNGNADSPEQGERKGAIEVPLESPKSMVKEGEKGLSKDALSPDADSDAPEMQAQPDMGEEADMGMDDEQLSDEELMEVYHSMSPEELERHYMASRAAMQSLYADHGMDAQADLQDEGAEQQPSQSDEQFAMSEEEDSEGEAMAKSEDKEVKSENRDKIEALEKKNKELEGSVAKIAELLLKNLEKPERKAVTDMHAIEYVKKSEGDVAGDKEEVPDMSDEDIKTACLSKSQDPKTTTEQRRMINDFYLNGEKSDELVKFLSGGNK